MPKTYTIGVLLHGLGGPDEPPGRLDTHILGEIKLQILSAAERLRARGDKISKLKLARELEIDRNRLARITEHLDITHIFDFTRQGNLDEKKNLQ